MAQNITQYGDVIDWTNGGSDVASGDTVGIGAMAGVALVDIAAGETGAVRVEGVVEVPKSTGTAWSQGQKVSWDTSAGEWDTSITPGAGDVQDGGLAWVAAASGDAVGYVKLTPGMGTAG